MIREKRKERKKKKSSRDKMSREVSKGKRRKGGEDLRGSPYISFIAVCLYRNDCS